MVLKISCFVSDIKIKLYTVILLELGEFKMGQCHEICRLTSVRLCQQSRIDSIPLKYWIRALARVLW